MAKFSWQRYFELWEKKKFTKKILSRFIQRIFYVSFKNIHNTKWKEKKIFEKYVFDLATIGMMTDDTNFICLHRQRIILLYLLYNLDECTKKLLQKCHIKPKFRRIFFIELLCIMNSF